MVSSDWTETSFKSVMAQACLTVRVTIQAETKVGHSDLAVEYGIAVA